MYSITLQTLHRYRDAHACYESLAGLVVVVFFIGRTIEEKDWLIGLHFHPDARITHPRPSTVCLSSWIARKAWRNLGRKKLDVLLVKLLSLFKRMDKSK